jgi:ubiquinone/menaquinone biosynthesis C-methylase UbiE
VFELAGTDLGAARKILDVGCGTGWWLGTLGADDRVNGALYGVELLPERAAAAREHSPSAEIVVGDARRLPFADGEFDAVTMFTVLSSLAGPANIRIAVREAARVLSADGVLLIWEPRWPNPVNRRTVFVGWSLLRSALPDRRLAVRTTTVAPPLARRLGAQTGRIYPFLARIRPLNTHRLVCARPAAPAASHGSEAN